jgi:hypothetical protein
MEALVEGPAEETPTGAEDGYMPIPGGITIGPGIMTGIPPICCICIACVKK